MKNESRRGFGRSLMLSGVGLGAAVALAASAALETDVTKAVDALTLTSAEAQGLYGFAKGVAEAAAAIEPAFAPVLAAALVIMDPIMADITAGTAAATAIADLVSEANKLILAVMGKVTVTGHA